jgi:hypothetical protein
VLQAPLTHVSAPLQKMPSLHGTAFSVVQVPGLAPLHVWQSVVTPLPHVLVQHTLSTHVSTVGLCRHICVRVHAPPMP